MKGCIDKDKPANTLHSRSTSQLRQITAWRLRKAHTQKLHTQQARKTKKKKKERRKKKEKRKKKKEKSTPVLVNIHATARSCLLPALNTSPRCAELVSLNKQQLNASLYPPTLKETVLNYVSVRVSPHLLYPPPHTIYRLCFAVSKRFSGLPRKRHSRTQPGPHKQKQKLKTFCRAKKDISCKNGHRRSKTPAGARAIRKE